MPPLRPLRSPRSCAPRLWTIRGEAPDRTDLALLGRRGSRHRRLPALDGIRPRRAVQPGAVRSARDEHPGVRHGHRPMGDESLAVQGRRDERHRQGPPDAVHLRGLELQRRSEPWTDVSSRLFVYDVAHDRLTRKADMPLGTAEGVTGVIDESCTCSPASAWASRSAATSIATTHRPTVDPAPPAPNSHRHGAGAAIGSKLYVAGGGASPYRAFDVYDAVTNRWSSPGLLPPRRQFAVGTAVKGKFWVVGIAGGERDGDRFATAPPLPTTQRPRPGGTKMAIRPDRKGGQFLLRPYAAVRVFFEGAQYLFAVGSGHLFTDDTVKPAGTIDPGPPYVYTPYIATRRHEASRRAPGRPTSRRAPRASEDDRQPASLSAGDTPAARRAPHIGAAVCIGERDRDRHLAAYGFVVSNSTIRRPARSARASRSGRGTCRCARSSCRSRSARRR